MDLWRRTFLRDVVLGSLVLAVVPASAGAQVTGFTCEDFLTRDAAQASLDRFPDDLYGLDPDGNGLACEDLPEGVSVPGSDVRLGNGAVQGEQSTGDVEPAEYEVVEEEFQQVGRPRVVSRIVVEDAGPKETAAALVEALEDGLANNPRAEVARVFAYDEGDNTDGGYTRGTAEGSRDGEGWTGDGRLSMVPFGSDPDERGMAFVILRSDESDASGFAEAIALPMDLRRAVQRTTQSPQQAATEPTAEESAYADTIVSQTSTVSDSMDTFGELISAPRIGQDDWTIQLAGVVVTWRFTQEEAEALTPPAAFAEVHESYLLGLTYLNLAGDDILAGIDNLDPVQLDQANANLQLATAQMAETTRLIDEIVASRK